MVEITFKNNMRSKYKLEIHSSGILKPKYLKARNVKIGRQVGRYMTKARNVEIGRHVVSYITKRGPKSHRRATFPERDGTSL